MPMQLVSLVDYIPDCICTLRYATADNVAGRVISQEEQPRLDLPAVLALQRIAKTAAAGRLRLVIWDAYRNEATQAVLLSITSDSKYVLEQSNHCKGLAIDMTLANMNGELLDMGTDHDDFSDLAHYDAAGITSKQAANRQILKQLIEQDGQFVQWPYEWWHFDYSGKD